MANINVIVSATGNYTIGIDSDNDGANNVFRVDQDGAGHPLGLLLTVDEAGLLLLGAGVTSVANFERSGAPVVFDNTGSGDLMEFQSGGTTVARITAAGLGDFSAPGVQVWVFGTDPNGTKPGEAGLISAVSALGSTSIEVNIDGGTTWHTLVTT